MQKRPASSGHLDDLHKEIDYFDRKIAYCRDLEKFPSEMERASAVHKLETKRATLVKAAAEITAMGIACNPKYLPRSFKTAPPETKIPA